MDRRLRRNAVHRKRRLELIIERMALARACNILEEAGMPGYTVLGATAGRGRSTEWQREGDPSSSQEMAVVISISDETRIEQALRELHRLVDAHIGVLSITDVEVLRPDRF
jgi:PII-like signaling protein